jgi:hypothetical protein
VVIIHGTRKFLDRVGAPKASPDEPSTIVLGSWYANVWFWRPQVALFVSEATLLPVLVPLTPARSVVQRFGAVLEEVLKAHGVAHTFIDGELAEMAEHRLAKTASRSVLGIMNEFAFLAEHHPVRGPDLDLVALSMKLSEVPCSPLYGRSGSPDRELQTLVARSGE